MPTGTVTFLFTDIERSTELWEQHPNAMAGVLARHDAILRQAIESHGGRVFSTGGDSLHASFGTAFAAMGAATAAQLALASEPWPEGIHLRVRMALHTGEADEREGDYFGPALNRAGRLRSAAHGGQTVVSSSTNEVLGGVLPPDVGLRDLGLHRLRDLGRPERVFELLHPGLRTDFPPLAALDGFPNNLPVQLTPLIGRDGAIDRLKSLLSASRLLTLTGVGGCGKTRLAIQLAADCLDSYPDGAWLVELAPLSDSVLVPATVACALGVQEEPGRAILDTLASYLVDRALLLVLDNCEHLIEACADLAEDLLQRCPSLRILATSREALGIGGERAFPVPSLALPDALSGTVADARLGDLARVPAVRLFIERATATKPAFCLTSENAQFVVDICRRLDGIPLALELAAARVRLLPVEEVDRRLDDRFRLLTGGSRTALPRQQALRAAIDWSHDLLESSERLLFRRLAVFRGGWSLAAAEAICAGNGIKGHQVVDLLGRLLDKSLAVADEAGGVGRYRMLQTISQYAADKLADSGESATVRDRHLGYFQALAEEGARELRHSHQGEWLDMLETEHDNLRSAIEWACGQDDPDRALCLSSALWRFWHVHGYWDEGQRYLARLLVHPGVRPGTREQAKALHMRANLLSVEGDLEGAWTLYEESLAAKRELGDRQGVAASLNNLGILAANKGDHDAADDFYAESLAILRELGDQLGISDALNNLAGSAADQGDYAAARQLYEESLAIGRAQGNLHAVANCLNNLADVARAQDDLERARALGEESLAISRKVGDQRLVAMVLSNLGAVACRRGEYSQARGLHGRSLVLRRQLGHKLGIADSLERLAELAAAEASPQRAGWLIGAAESLREAIRAPLPRADRQRIDAALTASGAALPGHGFEVARAQGSVLTMDEAVAYGLGEATDEELAPVAAERLAAATGRLQRRSPTRHRLS